MLVGQRPSGFGHLVGRDVPDPAAVGRLAQVAALGRFLCEEHLRAADEACALVVAGVQLERVVGGVAAVVADEHKRTLRDGVLARHRFGSVGGVGVDVTDPTLGVEEVGVVAHRATTSISCSVMPVLPAAPTRRSLDAG